jgi:spermidine dehydrogenase
MNSRDRRLGMARAITRRDFINGIGAIGAGLALPGCTQDGTDASIVNADYYPPELMGLRGNHNGVCLNYPVSIGDYSFAKNPDEPVMAYMMKFPHVSNQGLNQKETFRVGRHELLSTPFEDIERNVRIQLSSMLSEGGFDPASDILGITVNRWAHGYSYFYNSLFDTTYGAVETFYDGFNEDRYPHVRARQPFGRISIANSDSAATAMLEAAVEQGYRAATELLV